MKMLYISHPYTGNTKYNMHEAEEIAAELSNLYHKTLFINPLNVMKHLQNSSLSYDEILEQCIVLLHKCDGIILTGEWQNSKGCVEEFKSAKDKMPIYSCVDEFKRYYKEEL